MTKDEVTQLLGQAAVELIVRGIHREIDRHMNSLGKILLPEQAAAIGVAAVVRLAYEIESTGELKGVIREGIAFMFAEADKAKCDQEILKKEYGT